MHIETTIPPGASRVGAILSLASWLDSDELGAAIDALIERMDAATGDPDAEDDERAAHTMRSPGIDFDFDVEPLRPDGLAGNPEDAEIDDDPEDDDPAGGNVLDEPHDPEEDEGDDGAERGARRPHRDRIRRTRCEKRVHRNTWSGRDHVEYRVRDGVARIGRARIIGG